MEKNTTRIGTGDKRLLDFLPCRLVAKTATIFFFFCAAVILYGQQNDYAEHFIELKIDGTELSIDREFEIEVIIKREAPYLQKNNGDTPRFILERENETAEVIQSSAIPERDGLHLRYRYRFNKTGRFRFEPELQWKRQTVELTPLDITVHRPRLSEHTPFVWTLYSVSGLPVADGAALEQGTEYILCLTAAFYSAGYTERYRHALQTASAQIEAVLLEAGRSKVSGSAGLGSESAQAQDGRSGAAIRDTHSELPLPAEIVRIECAPSESTALKPLTLAELPFDAAVLINSSDLSNTAGLPDTGISSAVIPAASIPYEDSGNERYVLAMFSLIPLRIGVQSLPQAQIFFTAGGKSFSAPSAYRIDRQAITEAADKSGADGFTAAAFQALPPETQYSGSTMTEQEQSAAAKQIADYRKQEAAALFSPAIRRERRKLEAALEIAHPLPLYPRLLGILTAVISGLLLIGAAVCGFRNKKRFMLLCIIIALCSGTLAAVLFRLILRPQGVCIEDAGEIAVRRIPENTGTIIHRLSAGESVIIIRKTPQWYYIKTAGGVIGWIPLQSVIQYN
ncbi:SH3 domain-containing protein [Treponema sp. OMZ 857]|uniref:SH3 domain-containing protein n=1 Tax=Treponema sp. OMZ 857 TaxID=1643513 RepID=UPI0020A3E464|nr:SH3 domain-containing protein [Treponema sp. OMZ 857]UTC42683.1 SH3 domain-containing protein [Treponema sp. OMZ 857]